MIRVLSFVAGLSIAGVAWADDRYVGYYYPDFTSSEVFDRVIRPATGANKRVRVDFVTSLTNAQLAADDNPRFVFFAKGGEAKTLILIALDDQVFSTLFRARAVLAQLTSNMRDSAPFVGQDLQFLVTFFDLLQILEFDRLVISDGVTWTHQVNFVRR